ncbi:kinesin-like protein KIF18A isoform X2 [Macrobrachium rosenbergii]
MLGKPECPGITFLTLMELYRRIDELKEEKICEVGVSYLEVYNETVRDLLRLGKPLNVQENGSQVLVPGLSLHKPKDADDILKMLEFGNQNRTQHPTDANAESSRSHAVFQIFVRQQDRTANLKSNVCIAKLSMIDLAGSERGAATGFKGARFREGANINKSLLALGNCINALADGLRHVPYRDSKLTRLLKDSLGGNCRSVMIAAVSPSSMSFEDTFNTLRYANRAKTIKTTLKKNLMNVDHHVSQYVKIVEDLRKEICSLKDKVKYYEEKEDQMGKEQLELERAKENLEKYSELENEIEVLRKQLQEKTVEAAKARSLAFVVAEDEQEVQNCLKDISIERKALRRELLQLESSQRELELKIYNCNLRLQRMKMISYTSHRLDKSISKCERSIRNFTTRLEQTKKLQETLEGKLEANMNKLLSIQDDLNQWGHDTSQPSQSSKYLIEKIEASLVEHDIGRYSEYLKGILKEILTDHCSTEHFIGQLLHVVKEFYIQLRANSVCLPKFEQLFEGVIDSMDESKILWADQQSEEKLVQKPASDLTRHVLDVNRITHLPLLPSVYISPTVPQESNKVFRRSIMKNSKSAPSLHSGKLTTLSECESNSEEPEVLKDEITTGSEITLGSQEHVFPESPVLSTYSSEVADFTQEPSPVIGSVYAPRVNPYSHVSSCSATDSGDKTQSPLNNSSHSEPSYSLPTITTVEGYQTETGVANGSYVVCPTLADNHLPGSAQEQAGVISMPSLFVSMVDKQAGSKENPGNISKGLNTTELLEDIQPVECSMNATFAVTPAKALNVTMDLSSNVSALNTTVDLPNRTRDASPYTCLSTTKAFKTDEITNPNIRSCIDSIIASSKKILNTTVDLSGTGGPDDIPVCGEGKEKTASKKLFKQENLDSTFSVDNTSFGCSSLDSKSPVPVVRHGNLSQVQRSPLVPLENIQPPPVLKDPPFTSGDENLMQPPSSTKKINSKTGVISHKTLKVTTPHITKGFLSTSKTPKTPRSSGLRRSLSTSALHGKLNSSGKQIQESPVFKRKYNVLGNALSKTSNFVKMRNQENLPPSNVRSTPNHKSLVFKETVSSLAKHTSFKQQQKT